MLGCNRRDKYFSELAIQVKLESSQKISEFNQKVKLRQSSSLTWLFRFTKVICFIGLTRHRSKPCQVAELEILNTFQ